MNNKILQVIQAIPQILNQAKGQYKDDNSIVQIARQQGIDLNNALNIIRQYKNNTIVNNVARQFNVDLDALENKFSSLIGNNQSNGNNNNLDRFR